MDARSTVPTEAWSSPTGCDEGENRTPPHLLIAANRMVKPSIEGCGNGAGLGAERARLPAVFPGGHKYCHKRGHGLRPYPAAAGLGSNSAMMVPRAVPRNGALQGKSSRVRGSVPFGGRNGHVCLEGGTPADPPTFETAVPTWRPGDTIPLGRRNFAWLVFAMRTRTDLRCWSWPT
jgi:hypothetical protein